MKGHIIITGTVTYAMRAREILNRNGFNVQIIRVKASPTNGCGYGVVVHRNLEEAISLLKENEIKLLGVTERGEEDDISR